MWENIAILIFFYGQIEFIIKIHILLKVVIFTLFLCVKTSIKKMWQNMKEKYNTEKKIYYFWGVLMFVHGFILHIICNHHILCVLYMS